MARLSAAEQRAYEEELAYSRGEKPTTYERIKGAVGTAARVASDVGKNPHVRQVAGQQGFGGPYTAEPRHPTSRAQYTGAPIHETSVMHPGNRIIITRCNDETGQCKTIATGVEVSRRRAPAARRAPPGAVGGLGGSDPGFL